MKRLVAVAAIAALSAGVFAAEGAAAEPKEGAPAVPPPVAAEAGARAPRPAFDRAKFEERMRKRQEERRAKVADVLKAAGLAEDKVAGAVDEIDKIYVRRPPQRPVGARGMPRRHPRPQGGAPAQQ